MPPWVLDGLILVARVSVGFMFASGAVNKIAAPEWFAGTFVEAGLPFPETLSAVTAWVELIVGITLAVGLLTRASAVVSILIMVGAMVTVVLPPLVAEYPAPIAFLSNAFYTAEWLLVLILGFLLVLGSGRFGADAMIANARRARDTAAV